jgi:hypothetical protein
MHILDEFFVAKVTMLGAYVKEADMMATGK